MFPSIDKSSPITRGYVFDETDYQATEYFFYQAFPEYNASYVSVISGARRALNAFVNAVARTALNASVSSMPGGALKLYAIDDVENTDGRKDICLGLCPSCDSNFQKEPIRIRKVIFLIGWVSCERKLDAEGISEFMKLMCKQCFEVTRKTQFSEFERVDISDEELSARLDDYETANFCVNIPYRILSKRQREYILGKLRNKFKNELRRDMEEHYNEGRSIGHKSGSPKRPSLKNVLNPNDMLGVTIDHHFDERVSARLKIYANIIDPKATEYTNSSDQFEKKLRKILMPSSHKLPDLKSVESRQSAQRERCRRQAQHIVGAGNRLRNIIANRQADFQASSEERTRRENAQKSLLKDYAPLTSRHRKSSKPKKPSQSAPTPASSDVLESSAVSNPIFSPDRILDPTTSRSTPTTLPDSNQSTPTPEFTSMSRKTCQPVPKVDGRCLRWRRRNGGRPPSDGEVRKFDCNSSRKGYAKLNTKQIKEQRQIHAIAAELIYGLENSSDYLFNIHRGEAFFAVQVLTYKSGNTIKTPGLVRIGRDKETNCIFHIGFVPLNRNFTERDVFIGSDDISDDFVSSKDAHIRGEWSTVGVTHVLNSDDRVCMLSSVHDDCIHYEIFPWDTQH